MATGEGEEPTAGEDGSSLGEQIRHAAVTLCGLTVGSVLGVWTATAVFHAMTYTHPLARVLILAVFLVMGEKMMSTTTFVSAFALLCAMASVAGTDAEPVFAALYALTRGVMSGSAALVASAACMHVLFRSDAIAHYRLVYAMSLVSLIIIVAPVATHDRGSRAA